MKTFKEYYGGSIRVGGADSVVPMADLGDNPPKGQGGRDMRGVGLHASAGVKYLIYQTGNVGKTARIVMKNLKDIQTARDWIKDNGHSFDHRGKNFRIYQYKGNPNNIRPDDLIEDFRPVGQQKVSDLIFTGSAGGRDIDLLNLWIPISSTMFQRVFPKMVRARIFHVTEASKFEQLYRIQNSKSSIAGFQQMHRKVIQSGIASGAGVCVELEGNALLGSANDLGSIPVVDGRRFVSYDFFYDYRIDKKPKIPGMDVDLKKLIKTLIDKYADPEINRKRTSPYFSDYEVFKSIKATHTFYKGEGGQVAKDAGQKLFNCIKDYFDGIERILSKHQKQVQEVLTGYLRRRNSERNWDEIIVDDFNILKVFIIKDHEETYLFKKDQLDHEAFKKELQFTRLPVEIKTSDEVQRYVAQVSKVEKAKALRESTDLTKAQIKKVHKVADELPKKDFRDRYGKKKGDAVRYGTATNMVKKKLGLEKYDSDKTFRGKGTPEQRLQLLKLTTKALKTFPGSPKQKEIQKDINALRKKMGMKFKEELEERKLNMVDLDTVERYADRLFAKVGLDVEFTRHFLDRVNDARNGKQITQAELIRLFKQSMSRHKQSFQNLSKGAEAVLNDIKTDINMPFVIQVDNKGELDMVAKTIMRKKNFSTSNKKYTFEMKVPDDDLNYVKTGGAFGRKRRFPTFIIKKEGNKYKAYDEQNNMQLKVMSNSLESLARLLTPFIRRRTGSWNFEDKNPRIPRKPGQKAGSDKHSDLYTDENPKGTIHGLGFTDEKKARESINKIKKSGKTHAHKMQAAIAMSQRAKVASQRAKDPEKKKNLGQAHKIYQNYIDTNKKSKDD